MRNDTETNKINKKKIVKYAAVGVLSTAIALGSGIYIGDSTIDHYNEYCPLNHVFGVEHQIDTINSDRDITTRAYFLRDGLLAGVSIGDNDAMLDKLVGYRTINPIVTEVDGKVVYSAPEGYILEDGKAYQSEYIEKYAEDDAILITRSDVIYPEGSQPGDIVKRTDIEYGESEVINIIEKPNSTIKSKSTVSEQIQPKQIQPKTAVVTIPDEIIADSTIETIPKEIDSSIYEYAIDNDVRIVLSLEDNNYYTWYPTQYYPVNRSMQEDGSWKYTAIGTDKVVIDAQSGIVYAAKTSELELFDLQLLNNHNR